MELTRKESLLTKSHCVTVGLVRGGVPANSCDLPPARIKDFTGKTNPSTSLRARLERAKRYLFTLKGEVGTREAQRVIYHAFVIAGKKVLDILRS